VTSRRVTHARRPESPPRARSRRARYRRRVVRDRVTRVAALSVHCLHTLARSCDSPSSPSMEPVDGRRRRRPPPCRWEPIDMALTTPPRVEAVSLGSRCGCGAQLVHRWSGTSVGHGDVCIHRATSVFAGVMLCIGLAETDIVERAAPRWCGNGGLRRKRRCARRIHRATSTFANAVIRDQSGRRQRCRPPVPANVRRCRRGHCCVSAKRTRRMALGETGRGCEPNESTYYGLHESPI
jgi:hypothetical protein